MKDARGETLRRRVYEVLDVGLMHDPLSRKVHQLFVALIVVSVIVAVLESVPSLKAQFGALFTAIEVFALAMFSLEYGARIWSAVEHPLLRQKTAWRARLQFAFQAGSILDFLAIVPLIVMTVVGYDELHALLALRLLRFLKLTRYSPGMRSLVDAIVIERRALLSCLIILGALMTIAAAFMHLAEAKAQPDRLGTIPDAMYWALITLTTVGYGDITPITPAGRLVAGVTAIFGLVMVALPIGIIANSFVEVIHQHDFVVTWGMIARVPLFSSLEAADIVEIMRALHSQSAMEGEIIVRGGEHSPALFFVSSGEVEVELPDGVLRLEPGQFFGEEAVMDTTPRSGAVRACTSTKLMVLPADTWRHLLERQPAIARRIREAAVQHAHRRRV